jgi:hypothetical protein
MPKYRFKTEQEFKDDDQWNYRTNMPENWVSTMINQLGKPIPDSNNEQIETYSTFVITFFGFIYSSKDVKLMKNKEEEEEEEELLPIGTKVYITDDSEHFYQGLEAGKKVIGEILEHIVPIDSSSGYVYKVTWDSNQPDNTYQKCDVEPIEKREVNEEEINNKLKELFNQILNN